VETLEQLRERRAYECRLTPDRALASLDEAEAFLRDRGLLTRTADSALPSLYEACHEEAYRPGGRGFAEWPRTKWPWFGQLAERGFLVVGVHRGRNVVVTQEVAALLDPICRAELERLIAVDPEAARLLEHLAAAGPSNIEDLRVELALTTKQLKAVRSRLERCGALVSRSLQVTAGAGHAHSSELARWNQIRSTPREGAVQLHQAFEALLVAGVRAAVVAPERELRRWFSWHWYWQDTFVEKLVRDGLIRRVDGHVTAAETAS